MTTAACFCIHSNAGTKKPARLAGHHSRSEIYTFFGRSTDAPSKAAFYKQLQKIRDGALRELLLSFNRKLIVEIEKCGRKFEYQVNYSEAVKICRDFLRIHDGITVMDAESLIADTRGKEPDFVMSKLHLQHP